MDNLPLKEPAGILIKTTAVDFPGMIAGSFFLKGCNLRCPYCYNTSLVLNNGEKSSLNTIEELFLHLEKRRGLLKGLVISGGEPLLNPYTPLIINKAKELGYLVKLDTNGTLPGKLKQFIESKELKPDFIAMDLKTSPEKYHLLLNSKNNNQGNLTEHFRTALTESIDILKSYPPNQREWRTVLVPALVDSDDIKSMASILPADASWQFAQFSNENCLNPAYTEIYPYSDKKVQELIKVAKSLISGAELR